ncbi:carboxylesterase family protein [Dyadobacter sandarakinus]|uniref:Carboxylesterase family protein n=1 Tax=Dyadobacter sandarakinus TaxID=2747268 RepID=A0ABX7I7P5_9BACT|nr:alpha/beta hydrolase [Dyadobacter sandarakinus]QRR01011.1 carboxylesterase family protein [Dyadobacter sandarakinus]
MQKLSHWIMPVLGLAMLWSGSCKPAKAPDPVVITPDSVARDTAMAVNPDEVLAASARFGSGYVFADSALKVITGTFRQANDFIGSPVTMSYTFVAPEMDTMQYRPFVLMVHEGAFLFGDQVNELGKARYLARKGYAVACINYRLGFNGGSEANPCGGNTMEVVQAVYRAVQDTYAALHFFAGKSEAYGIDRGQMILAGSSAGAITVSALAYMKEIDFESLQTGIINTLGRLDPDPNGKAFSVRALLTYLGYGVFKTSYIKPDNVKPTVFFQRTGDDILPYEKGNLFFCPFYLTSEGARPVSQELKKLAVPYELNFQPETGHQLSYSNEYVANRYAMFMKRLWGKDYRQLTIRNYTTQEDLVLP